MDDTLWTSDQYEPQKKDNSKAAALRKAAANKKASEIGTGLGVVGGAIGAYFGGPQGAMTGFNLGKQLGGEVGGHIYKGDGSQGFDLNKYSNLVNLLGSKDKKKEIDFSKLSKEEISNLSDSDKQAYDEWLSNAGGVEDAVDISEIPELI